MDGKEKNIRVADGSVRFNAHPSKNVLVGIMEMVDNQLTYAKSRAYIEIMEDSPRIWSYKFVNDGTPETIPTFDRIKEIASTAGSSISAKEGISLCGIGIEVMGLSCRRGPKMSVSAKVNVNRKHLNYGMKLTFDGKDQQIYYELIEPTETDAEDSFEISFDNCHPLKKAELDDLKCKISDIMPDDRIKVILNHNGILSTILKNDFLYRKQLEHTDNFEIKKFRLADFDDEEIVVELSDVSSIIVSKNGSRNRGNEYEYIDSNGKQSPSLSGGCLRYCGIGTVCRKRDGGWGLVGMSPHSTKNGIRFDISVGPNGFRMMHQESQVKSKTLSKINELTDENGELLKVYDEDGNIHDISIINNVVSDFVAVHKSDTKHKKTEEEVDGRLAVEIVSGKVNKSEMAAAVKVLGIFDGCKLSTKKVVSILNNHIIMMEETVKSYAK